ncbi:hypothetical protein [Chenggangzhangella methanolivorans]|uniref:Transcriptional coactivator p15 (PC4) C-terminal domain-containing protein n=1 Tax=Chenggangzhangella methanolivorans TaxID=1437009 RepID=A0A9E6R5F0_9HYPH|nr:hypothetical protein [Chenggangzhangella methanolivorans]QZN98540.1 hypothetical protein K6K41_16010 [Chenggangzhangella methanolivorans]
MRDRIVAHLRKNDLSSLVVRLTTFRGRRCVDVRVYDDPVFEKGFAATSVGVSIRPDLLRSMIEALEAAEQAAIREGLISPIVPPC